MRWFCTVLILTIVTLGGAERLAAQTEISSRAATLQVGGRLHWQYQASSVRAAPNDFFIRRARINVDAAFNDFFTATVLTDFASGRATLLDAYVRLDLAEGLRIYTGQFKRAFDLFELVSSTDLSIVERTGEVGGYSACTGVGSVCSYSRLSERLAYSGRDAGVKIDGSSGDWSYSATITNGTGVGIRDENDGKSVSGRVSYTASGDIVVSAQLGTHDYTVRLGETATAHAWGIDVQVGDWRDGLLLQSAVMGGDNWESLDGFDRPGIFLALQAVVSYYHPLAGDRIIGVEPLLRLSVADPDDTITSDGGTLLTPGVMLYVTGKNKIGVNLDYYAPRTVDAVYSLRFATFLYF